MATLKDWNTGHTAQLAVGVHYDQKARTLDVPEGQVVYFWNNRGRKGKPSVPFYQGHYDDLTFYGLNTEHAAVEVKSTDARWGEFIRLNDYQKYYNNGQQCWYNPFQILPTGDHNGRDAFRNDSFDEINIPLGITIKVYKDYDFKGEMLEFSGQHDGEWTTIDLHQYGLRDKMSSIRVIKDDWELIGARLSDEQIKTGTGETVAATATVTCDGKATGSYTKTITGTYTESTEETIETGGSLAHEFGVEIGGESVGVKVTDKVTVEVHASYANAKAQSKEIELSDSISIDANHEGVFKVSLIVEFGTMEGTIVRTYRNKRTGKHVDRRSQFTANRANSTRVDIREIAD